MPNRYEKFELWEFDDVLKWVVFYYPLKIIIFKFYTCIWQYLIKWDFIPVSFAYILSEFKAPGYISVYCYY